MSSRFLKCYLSFQGIFWEILLEEIVEHFLSNAIQLPTFAIS